MAEDLTQAVQNLTRVVENLDALLRRDYPKRAEVEREFVSKHTSRRLTIWAVVIILIVAGLSGYFYVRLGNQQNCYERKLVALSQALGQRASLTEEETAQNKALWMIYANAAGLIKDDPTQELEPEDREQLQRDLVAQLLEYRREIIKIEEERSKRPLPPYPVGSC